MIEITIPLRKVLFVMTLPFYALGGTSQSTLSKEKRLINAVEKQDKNEIEDVIIHFMGDHHVKIPLLYWAVSMGSFPVLKVVLEKIRSDVKRMPGLEISYDREIGPVGLIKILCKKIAKEIKWNRDGSGLCIVEDGKAYIWQVLERRQMSIGVRWTDISTLPIWNCDKNIDLKNQDAIAKVPKALLKKLTWSPSRPRLFERQFDNLLARSFDGSLYCIKVAEKIVEIWDAKEMKMISSLEHEEEAHAAVWNQNNNIVCIMTWIYVSGEEADLLEALTKDVGELDENYFDGPGINAPHCYDGNALIWDIKNKSTIAKLKHEGWVTKAAWSPDGSKICVLNANNSVEIWHLPGRVLDWAIGALCAGGDSSMVQTLLDECENLKGMCNESLLLNLCQFTSNLKSFDFGRYEVLCGIISMIANKPGAPL